MFRCTQKSKSLQILHHVWRELYYSASIYAKLMHVEENKVVKCVTPRKKRLDCNMSEGVFRCKFFWILTL